MVNFREIIISSGLQIFGGKDAASNDELVYGSSQNDILLHTYAPGSPFVNVGKTPSKKDIKEAAIFCAKYSQDWRDGKKDIVVNKFLRSDMSKSKNMETGSWNVKRQEKIIVKKAEILKFERELTSKI